MKTSTGGSVREWLAARRPAAIPRRRDDVEPRASSAQQRMWFEDRYRRETDPSLPGYASPQAVRMTGPLDLAALEAALRAVVARHETLRTTFVTRGGTLYQRINPPGPVDFLVETVPDDATLPTALATAIAEPLDLAQGPILRARLFRLTDTDHVLLVVVHHIATDGWSMDILFRELTHHYTAQPELPPLPIQYADYAAWQLHQLETGAHDDDLTYWRHQLTAAPPVLTLPTDRPRPARQSFRGDAVPITVSAAMVSRMAALARDTNASLFMVLLAAGQLLASRWSGQPDVVIGASLPSRVRPELEPLIGFFANLLPIRTRVDETETFRTLLARVRDTVLDAYDRQHLSFGQLVEELAPQRSPAHSSLVQVVLALDEGAARPALGERVPVPIGGQSHFDLALVARHDEGVIGGDLFYATDLFDRRTISRFVEHLCALLDDVTAEPDRALAQGPVATRDDIAHARRQAVARPVRRELGEVVSPVLAAAKRRPGAVAVSDEHGNLSFGELAARSGWVADELVRRGVGRGDAVGVCLPRGADWLTVLLGVWRAGAVYVPLDRSYPAARLTAIVEDRRPALIVGRGDAPPPGGWPAAGNRWEFDTLAGRAGGEHTTRPAPAEPAYTIYTSGSTGRPKGVEVSHRALANTISAARDVFELRDTDCCAQLSNAGFDASLWEALPALVAGGRVAVFSDHERVDTIGLWESLAARGVTVGLLTTSVLGAARASAPADHPTLRYLQTGGDRLAAVPPTLPAPLWNIYGPTEAAIAATAGVVHPGDAVHIGGPLPGTRAYVLDPWLRPVPTGVPGELFLAGAGIALGYHGASGLTAQRFLPDVVAGDGSRMYRTGDLVRRGVDGTIAYLRRVDRQVKVRGQRIELGEIESVLAAVPGVAAAVVTLRDGALVAHYVAAGVDGPGEEDLRQQLGLRLPEAMLPTRYVLLDALPTTPNGKVDQAALPEPPAAGNGAAPAPLDGLVQEIIADVWRELLPVETVSATDNFFALGGHSLLAARVATRLSDRFGLPVPLTQVFELPVLAHLAAAVEERVMAQVLAAQALSPQASEPA